MRKTLLPMLASLLICGTATVALIATSARAGQTARNPVMLMAQNQTMAPARAADGTPPPMDRRMPGRGELCENLYASRAAGIAFLEAKLQLNSAQRPLFARWKDISLDRAKRHEEDCRAHAGHLRAGERPDMVEQLSREEDMLKARLADIQAERPALTALYAGLTPAQKEEFAGLARHAMGERLQLAGRMMHGAEMGHRFGRGPDGAPPPPPPPPQ